MIASVDYHITDRCNLNCAHCSHFSSLVPSSKPHKTLTTIVDDLLALSKFKEHLGTLALLGGEPFLHPSLDDICYIARGIFPNNNISLTTNGTFAKEIGKHVRAINDNDIEVVQTLYPYNGHQKDFEIIKQAVKRSRSWDFPVKYGMTYCQLSNESGVATRGEVLGCYKRWLCNQLKDRKLWICHYAACLDDLKVAFPGQVNIEQDERCYIDLTTPGLTIEDIYEWEKTTYPSICDHCLDIHTGGYDGPVEAWRTTEHKLEEWVQ